MEAVMGKLSTEEKDRIIKRDLPGYRIVEQSPEDSADAGPEYLKPQPEAGTPDIRELRRKYFGLENEWANGPDSSATDAAESGDDEIVTVEPENKSDALDRGGRAKAVVISNGEVTGSQG
jgi:hypothetical protein